MTMTREIRKAIHSVFTKKKNKNHDLKVGRSCKNNLKKKYHKEYMPVCENDEGNGVVSVVLL